MRQTDRSSHDHTCLWWHTHQAAFCHIGLVHRGDQSGGGEAWRRPVAARLAAVLCLDVHVMYMCCCCRCCCCLGCAEHLGALQIIITVSCSPEALGAPAAAGACGRPHRVAMTGTACSKWCAVSRETCSTCLGAVEKPCMVQQSSCWLLGCSRSRWVVKKLPVLAYWPDLGCEVL